MHRALEFFLCALCFALCTIFYIADLEKCSDFVGVYFPSYSCFESFQNYSFTTQRANLGGCSPNSALQNLYFDNWRERSQNQMPQGVWKVFTERRQWMPWYEVPKKDAHGSAIRRVGVTILWSGGVRMEKSNQFHNWLLRGKNALHRRYKVNWAIKWLSFLT